MKNSYALHNHVRILKRRIGFLVLGILITNGLLFSSPAISRSAVHLVSDKKQIARQLLQEGLDLAKIGDKETAIGKFREALKYDRRLAAAHHQLALIYIDNDTVYDRFTASNELEQAILLDWNNVEYRFTNALLYLKKDMAGAAKREFQRIVKLDPENYLAYYHLGLILEKDVLRYRDMIDPEPEAIIYFRAFAEKDKDKVVYYFNKAIALNPQFTEVYYRLGLIYYEFGDLDDMVQLLKQAVSINTQDKNCHLFLGFAYYEAHKYQLAQQMFERAMKLLEPEELEILNSIEMIMSPEQKADFENASLRKQEMMESEFWKKRDPFFLTKFNERKLEHYSRVAYANLRFFIPLKNVDGWKTDQGKVYIRYGKPRVLYRTRPELGAMASANGGSPLITSKEVWIYPDFDFIFEDRSLLHRYEFAWGDRPENDYRSVYEQRIKETPEYYQYLPPEKQLAITTDFCEFKGESHKTDVNVSYAIAGDSIYFVLRDHIWQAQLKRGIFILDDQWNIITQDTADIIISEDFIKRAGTEKYYIDYNQVGIAPGTYRLALEFHDQESDKRGTFRDDVDVHSFETQELQLSDIFLSLDIKADSLVGSLSQQNLEIVPNPIKQFSLSTPVFIYYEIYNLGLDNSRLSLFKIDYKIGSNRNKASGIRKLLTKIGFMKTAGDVTTSYQYVGNSSEEFQYQRLDLSSQYVGDVVLEVTVTDLLHNESSRKTVEFEIISDK